MRKMVVQLQLKTLHPIDLDIVTLEVGEKIGVVYLIDLLKILQSMSGVDRFATCRHLGLSQMHLQIP